MKDSAIDPQPVAESFYPLHHLDEKIRRRPWPDKTFDSAISMAMTLLEEIQELQPKTDTVKALIRDASQVHAELGGVLVKFRIKHLDFPDKCQMSIEEFNHVWRDEVATLIGHYQRIEGTQTK